MFGKLQGVVDYIGNGFIIIMTGGVGYKVTLSASSLAKIAVGSGVAFWIETIVREDSISLIGFESTNEQDLFVKLVGVSGIGPKVAMAILGSFKVSVLENAIISGDVKTLTSVPGVGKKVAERILVELKGKVFGSADVSSASSVQADVLAALESLGYKRADCIELVQNLCNENPNDKVQSLITKALKAINNAQ